MVSDDMNLSRGAIDFQQPSLDIRQQIRILTLFCAITKTCQCLPAPTPSIFIQSDIWRKLSESLFIHLTRFNDHCFRLNVLVQSLIASCMLFSLLFHPLLSTRNLST